MNYITPRNIATALSAVGVIGGVIEGTTSDDGTVGLSVAGISMVALVIIALTRPKRNGTKPREDEEDLALQKRWENGKTQWKAIDSSENEKFIVWKD